MSSTHEEGGSDDEDDDDEEEVQQEAGDDEATKEEIRRSESKTPCPQFRRLCKGPREDVPAGGSGRELRGNPSKAPGFKIPVVMAPPSQKCNVPVKTT